MLDRERLGNCAAGRVAQHMGAFDLEPVHQRDRIAGHPVDSIATANGIALADPTTIVRDDLVTPGKRGDLLVPKRRQTAQPRYHHYRKAGTVPLVMKRAIADGDTGHRIAKMNVFASVSPLEGGCQREPA